MFNVKNEEELAEAIEQLDLAQEVNVQLPPKRLAEDFQSKYECTKKILEQAYEKLKISLLLPRILDNLEEVEKCLKKTKYSEAPQIIKDFLIHGLQHGEDPFKARRTIMFNKLAFERRQLFTSSVRFLDQLNMRYVRFIEYFHDHPKVMHALPRWLDELDDDDKNLLEMFDMMKKIALARLENSAKFCVDAEPKLQALFKRNEDLKAALAGIQALVQKQKNRINSQKGDIQAFQASVLDSMAAKNEAARYHAFVSKEKIAVQGVELSRQHREAMNKKTEELEAMKMQSKKVKLENSKREDFIRRELAKQIGQYEKLVQKRDKTLWQKFHEIEALRVVHEREKKIFMAAEEHFNKKKERYEVIVTAFIERTVFLFRRKHAVRTIERWICGIWRERVEHELEEKREKELALQEEKNAKLAEKQALKEAKMAALEAKKQMKAVQTGSKKTKNVHEEEEPEDGTEQKEERPSTLSALSETARAPSETYERQTPDETQAAEPKPDQSQIPSDVPGETPAEAPAEATAAAAPEAPPSEAPAEQAEPSAEAPPEQTAEASPEQPTEAPVEGPSEQPEESVEPPPDAPAEPAAEEAKKSIEVAAEQPSEPAAETPTEPTAEIPDNTEGGPE